LPIVATILARHKARILAELYLVTVFQYLETMPDNQAADAVRDRRDWKYALHLPLNVLGHPAADFCEFRRLLKSDPDSLQTLQVLVGRLAEGGASINGESSGLEAGQIVARVCLFSRLANTWEAFVRTLGSP
jgi:transposase